MKKLRVIIADNDKEYSRRLFAALERKYANLDLTLADSAVFGSLVQKRLYDVALFDISAYSRDINLKNVKLPVALLDEDVSDSVALANSIGRYVNKYQHIEKMYKKIIGYFSEIDGGHILNSGGSSSQLICIYSPAGGTGKTVISCAVSEMIANRGGRALYLNFENISSYGPILGASVGKGLDEIIYQLDKGINMPMKIKSLVKKSPSGVLFFDMFSNIMDVTEITEEKMSALIDTIMTSDVCDYMIVDMSAALDGINRVLLERADKIIFVETPDSICREKFLGLNSCRGMFEEYFSKAAVVKNKMTGSAPDAVPDLEVVSSVPKINSDNAAEVIDDIVKKSRLDIGRIIS